MKRIAIMQPYIFPYIGYFQLINAVDEFVIYDNIQFTKKGWINRNRILVNGTDDYITFPLKKDSDYLQIKDRFLADNWAIDRKKILNKIKESYRRAPFFGEVYEIIEKCILYENSNLFNFILHSLEVLNNYLDINTKIIVSSSIEIDHKLKSIDKVIAICKHQKSEIYINPIGGTCLYDKQLFHLHNLELIFLKSSPFEYNQFDNKHIPWLSIIDVLMFNCKADIQQILGKFEYL